MTLYYICHIFSGINLNVIEMRKLLILLLMALGIQFSMMAEKHFDLGFTTSISYADYFSLALEPTIGYEFSDIFAMGTGIGMGYNSNADASFWLMEPFLRFTPCHSDFFFFDLKADAAWGWAFGEEDNFLLFRCGLIPSLRFRVSDHWDISADIGMFGVQENWNRSWVPQVGIGSLGVWATYRF